MLLNFTKMNGAGNDFVLLDNRDGQLHLDAKSIARLCDRHRGVGADGVLLVEPSQNRADFRMRYYNADGGEAEMCGNGARCFARFANRIAGVPERISFETMAGVITSQCLGDLVKITMSEPRDLSLQDELVVDGVNLTVHSLNTGVPHAVVLVEDVEKVEIARFGPALRYHKHFAPRGANVNFIQSLGATSIAIRTYERGVEGETLACGTGVVASAIIYHELTGAGAPVKVRVRGGDSLEVSFEKPGETYQNVTLTGPADFVFDGQIEV